MNTTNTMKKREKVKTVKNGAIYFDGVRNEVRKLVDVGGERGNLLHLAEPRGSIGYPVPKYRVYLASNDEVEAYRKLYHIYADIHE